MSTAGGGGGGRRVTIRSISCRGVKAFVPFQKPPLYAAVSLAGRREKTSGDPDGGENPDWDAAVFAFDLPAAADGMLQFEVKAQVPLLGSKLVGKVSVPLADLAVAGGDGAAAAPRHVSYQVCAPDGKANGKLSFTFAVTGGGAYQQPQVDHPTPISSSCCAPPPTSTTTTTSGAPYPPPAMASYPPLPSLSATPSASLYPPPPPSSYPPPPPPPPPPPHVTQSFAPNSSYPPPPPPSQYIAGYPPPPPSNFYPPPPAGYPAPSFPSPTSTYPPPPPPESASSQYPPPLPRSAPCCDRSVDRALPSYMSPRPPPPGAPCYPPPAAWLPDQEAAGAPYSLYPQPGTRYL
ncbi:leucine-rich repeat extensin-like protein 3 [Oryza sativa Japonica Group]|uniref:C2 domain containing protein, expressed n=2 Tax=Oryza sativa subsp. japonica TaxID=39947 RepID=Q2R360_ORYSJ|nr:leucine-rich repeat extensin-like protein 3 [Oryza sativa Japonica Group]ABA94080.2 C2 domain containing protein, expressed [Oryza sativa Japonica Group]KAF2911128.1 hypothetical protein DAI22_11g154300 [Oryza sativa Japonica Group]BAH95304.1 Os11g0535600 [Oryza sativa Japonica Group]|eukprot:NP_001176576.1 Os11g0535600 [Oryza sativa Japonica Group]